MPPGRRGLQCDRVCGWGSIGCRYLETDIDYECEEEVERQRVRLVPQLIEEQDEEDEEDEMGVTVLIEMGVTVRHSLSLRFRGPSAN